MGVDDRMRRLRQPNGSQDWTTTCDSCGSPIRGQYTGKGLWRWFHYVEDRNAYHRWCQENPTEGETRTMATFQGSAVPTGQYWKPMKWRDGKPIPPEDRERVFMEEEEVDALLDIIDQVQDKLGHR